MRRIREVLRLRYEQKLTQDQIAAACKIARSSVGDCLRRCVAADLTWPLPAHLDDDGELEKSLYNPKRNPTKGKVSPPDWQHIHRELPRKGVTLQLLWQEYKGKRSGKALYQHARSLCIVHLQVKGGTNETIIQ